MSKQRNALGRGLSALLEDNDTVNNNEGVAKRESSVKANALNEIPLSSIETNPWQPRDHFDQEALLELAESIQLHGIIQPITVRRMAENQYQLISGERRFQASKIAGLENIPAYIRTANDQQMLEMALIENIQRENLNAIEVALSYKRLLSECNLKQEDLGDRVGKKRTTVNNYLRLLRLPPDIQLAVRDNSLSMGHARALINIPDIDLQLALFKKVVEEELSVRKTEELVRLHLEGGIPKVEEKAVVKKELGAEYKNLQNQLSSHFGTKVMIADNGKNKGEIKIPYVSVEDLNRILEILRL